MDCQSLHSFWLPNKVTQSGCRCFLISPPEWKVFFRAAFNANWSGIQRSKVIAVLLEQRTSQHVACAAVRLTRPSPCAQVPYEQGLAMLAIFAASPSVSSILDYFALYDTRQQLLQEDREKAKLRPPPPGKPRIPGAGVLP